MKPSAEMTVGPFFPPEFARGADKLALAGSRAIEVTGRVTQADGKRRVSIGMMLLGQGVSVTLPAEALTRVVPSATDVLLDDVERLSA